MKLEADIEFRTSAWTNARGHTASKKTSQRKKAERTAALVLWTHLGRPKLAPAPCKLTFIRFAPRELDDDNLPSFAKVIRDELVWLMGYPDDARRSGVRFAYQQFSGIRGYRVKVILEYSPRENEDRGELDDDRR